MRARGLSTKGTGSGLSLAGTNQTGISMTSGTNGCPMEMRSDNELARSVDHMNRSEDMEAHCRGTYGAGIQALEINDPGRTTLLCHADDPLIGYGQFRWKDAPEYAVAPRPAEIRASGFPPED